MYAHATFAVRLASTLDQAVRGIIVYIPHHGEGTDLASACLLQDIVRQVEQGGAKVLQAVDWPQSSPDNGKDQVSEDQSRDSGESTEPGLTGQVTGSCSLSGEPE